MEKCRYRRVGQRVVRSFQPEHASRTRQSCSNVRSSAPRSTRYDSFRKLCAYDREDRLVCANSCSLASSYCTKDARTILGCRVGSSPANAVALNDTRASTFIDSFNDTHVTYFSAQDAVARVHTCGESLVFSASTSVGSGCKCTNSIQGICTQCSSSHSTTLTCAFPIILNMCEFLKRGSFQVRARFDPTATTSLSTTQVQTQLPTRVSVPTQSPTMLDSSIANGSVQISFWPWLSVVVAVTIVLKVIK
jgi:hypothetical protein